MFRIYFSWNYVCNKIIQIINISACFKTRIKNKSWFLYIRSNKKYKYNQTLLQTDEGRRGTVKRK